MTLISQTVIMLAGNPATLPAGTADINKNGVGGIISNLFAFVGILLIIYGIWKVVQDIMKGSIGKAVMTAALFGAAGALCLDLNLGITLLSSMKGLVKAIIDTFNSTATGGGTPTVDPTQRV